MGVACKKTGLEEVKMAAKMESGEEVWGQKGGGEAQDRNGGQSLLRAVVRRDMSSRFGCDG